MQTHACLIKHAWVCYKINGNDASFSGVFSSIYLIFPKIEDYWSLGEERSPFTEY